jgi:hypothetical protein
MADAFLLSIDLNKNQGHFANTGEPMSFEAVETWLREMGFKRTEVRPRHHQCRLLRRRRRVDHLQAMDPVTEASKRAFKTFYHSTPQETAGSRNARFGRVSKD